MFHANCRWLRLEKPATSLQRLIASENVDLSTAIKRNNVQRHPPSSVTPPTITRNNVLCRPRFVPTADCYYLSKNLLPPTTWGTCHLRKREFFDSDDKKPCIAMPAIQKPASPNNMLPPKNRDLSTAITRNNVWCHPPSSTSRKNLLPTSSASPTIPFCHPPPPFQQPP